MIFQGLETCYVRNDQNKQIYLFQNKPNQLNLESFMKFLKKAPKEGKRREEVRKEGKEVRKEQKEGRK